MRRFLAATLVLAFALGARAGWEDPFFDDSAAEGRPLPAPEVTGFDLNGRYWVVVPASDVDARSRIADAGVSIEQISPGKIGGVATVRALRRLGELGIRVEKKTALEQFGLEQFPEPDKAFHDYAEVQSELASIASSNKDAATLFSIGTSVQGRDISGIRLTLNSGLSNGPWRKFFKKPAIAFLGTHHAREHLSTEVPLKLARWLAENRTKPEIKKLLENREIFIIPLVNPDGAEYDHSSGNYRWQRKNMRKNEDGSLGVDLNRNYGFGWGGGGASKDPGSDTYRGPHAFSEPETQAVKNFVESHPNLKILLSYHTFSELILYPWGHTHSPIEDGKALAAYRAMAEKMAAMTGYTPQQSSELYIASGDTTDWAWGAKKIFAFTFELTPKGLDEGGFYPGAGAIEPTFQKNIAPALYLIDLADNPYRAAVGNAS